jgi:hypothetical protein
MKLISLILISLAIGCSSKPKVPDYDGALRELMRNGVPQSEMYPDYYSRTSHTCTSTPIYDLEGYYVRHDIRCH